MVVNLIERSGTQERLPDFHPPDPRLVVAKELSLPVQGYDETVTGWLPGYSSQGDHAMVKLLIPWSVHVVEATYWLSKSDGHWKVERRKFTYYV
ncbi:hypothetical protein [Planctomicrobium piriforme]|nr:hypothetical protein [Planctomicrobium piriforme]